MVPSVNFLNLVIIVYVTKVLFKASLPERLCVLHHAMLPRDQISSGSAITIIVMVCLACAIYFILQVYMKYWHFFSLTVPYFSHLMNIII